MFSDLLPRVFIHKENGQEIILSDSDRNLSPEEVCDSYAALYAILATAKIVGPELKDDTARYQFVTTLGTKG